MSSDYLFDQEIKNIIKLTTLLNDEIIKSSDKKNIIYTINYILETIEILKYCSISYSQSKKLHNIHKNIYLLKKNILNND